MTAVRLTVLSICVLMHSFVFGQSPVASQISVENGLPSNTIYSIIQTPDGYLWAGTESGLCRYNGIVWETFRCREQRSSAITGLCYSPSGAVYCFNFSGQLFSFESGQLKELPAKEKLIRNIAMSKEGDLYISGEKGLQKYSEKEKRFTTINEINNSLGDGSIPGCNNIQIDREGRIWCGTRNSILRWDNRKVEIFKAELQAQDYQLLHMYQLKVTENGTWLFSVMNTAVYVLEDEGFKRYSNPDLYEKLNGRKITNVEYSNGVFWIGTYSGLIVWDVVEGSVDLWFDHLAITDVLNDAEGNTWFATVYHGLFRSADLQFKRWDPAGHLQGRTHVTNAAGLNGQYYFTTESGRIYRCAPGSSIEEVKREKESDIQFMVSDHYRGQVLFGSNGQLSFIRGETTGNTTIESPSLRDAVSVKQGYFIASATGVSYYSDAAAKSWVQTPVSQRANDLLPDSSERMLWVATQTGVCLMDISDPVNSRILFRALDSLSIRKLSFATIDEVLALTADNRIFRIFKNGNSELLFTSGNNMQLRDIETVRGLLYAATNKGMLCVDIMKGTTFLADDVFGLGTNDIGTLDLVDNTLLLSSGFGLLSLPVPFSMGRSLPAFDVRELYVDGLLVNDHDGMELDVEYSSTLSLFPHVIGFSSSGDYVISYRFSGDSIWNEVSVSDKPLTFSGLPSGESILELRIRDHFGNYAQNTIRLRLHVKPPFWNTWWFYTLGAIVFIGLTTVAFSYRIALIRKRQLQELRRLRLESDLRVSRQTALTAQMNPHFIFNVLNSIKGYIYDNDKEHAALYLDSFSSLVRNVLEMSALPRVNLEEEITLLRSYIELEGMMLEDEFRYQIEIAEDIDTHWVKIPSLLIQPIVENAFKHGLRNKKGMKFLFVGFEMDPGKDVLCITIRDNGIGRKESARLQQERTGHRSFASSATESRIALLNQDGTQNVGVEYEDLEEGGTKVTLHLHILQDRNVVK